LRGSGLNPPPRSPGPATRWGTSAAGADSRCACCCLSRCWSPAGPRYTWQQNQRAAELVEIDSQLLTDDLPIDAYLDRNFQNWLKKREAAE